MNKLVPAVLMALAAAACQTDTQRLEKKVDDLTALTGQLSRKLDVVAQGRGAPAAARPSRPQPDPGKTYALAVDGDPSDGPADAKVTLVKVYDYLCPYCERAGDTLAQLRAKYGDDLRIVYKQYVVHPQAQLAHLAACAANKQGHFLAMDKLLWTKAYPSRQIDEPTMTALAKEAGLDEARFAADLKSDGCAQWLDKERQDLAPFAVGATPTFFINGRYHVGAEPQVLAQLVEEELAKANQRLAQGASKADYYKTWVLAKGEPRVVAMAP